MGWKTDEYVVHTKRPEWGVGKIIRVDSEAVTVFFVGSGKRALGQPAALIVLAPPELHCHPLLARIAPSVLSDEVKFLPLRDCVDYFHKLFPDGFYDAAYMTKDPKAGERHYKVVASEMAHALLGKAVWEVLIESGKFGEICQRLAKVESKTNLLHSFEKIKWHAALKVSHLQKPISISVFNDIYGVGSRMSRFDALAKVLGELDGCAKWTIATYYGYLLQPEPRIFIKPEVTKFAAEACGWDLQYQSSLNWNTLHRAEEMASYLFAELTRRGLRPRDMIDVQSFIWCIDPKSYG